MPTDFEDMSCEMVYGQAPPPFEEDPVSKQPCLADICESDDQNLINFNTLMSLIFTVSFPLAGSMSNPSSDLCPKLQA